MFSRFRWSKKHKTVQILNAYSKPYLTSIWNIHSIDELEYDKKKDIQEVHKKCEVDKNIWNKML